MMLEHKVRHGASNRELAQEFGVSKATVDRTLSWAKKAQLIVGFEDKILNELMPEAHQAIKRLLQDTENPVESAKIAMELLKGFLPAFKKTQSTSGGGSQSDELSRYINEFREGLGVLEGEVATGGAQRALPPAKTEDSPQGLPASSDGDDRQQPESSITALLGIGLDEGSDGDSE